MKLKNLINYGIAIIVVYGLSFAARSSGNADSEVELLSQIARDNLSQAILQDGSHIPPETAAEKKQEILPFEYRKYIVQRGIMSAMMQTCDLDWKPGFAEMIKQGVVKYKITPKQRAYIGLLHGVAQGYSKKSIEAKGCTPQLKAALKKQL